METGVQCTRRLNSMHLAGIRLADERPPDDSEDGGLSSKGSGGEGEPAISCGFLWGEGLRGMLKAMLGDGDDEIGFKAANADFFGFAEELDAIGIAKQAGA